MWDYAVLTHVVKRLGGPVVAPIVFGGACVAVGAIGTKVAEGISDARAARAAGTDEVARAAEIVLEAGRSKREDERIDDSAPKQHVDTDGETEDESDV